MKMCLLLVFAAFCYWPIQAQQITVTGKLLSGKDQTPLAGVSIRASTSRGTVTREDGSFTLQTSPGVTLHLSMEGFLPKEVRVTHPDMGVIVMEPTQRSLDSVVVVGYGTQKKVNLTGSIATVNMQEKQGQPITNVSNALHGVPGLFVNLSNSQPGVDRSTIRIRGIGTLNSNDPLVLVDGIEYSMDELNPEDIASITVLKDASAAIYGSRAANGVILVTTKKGQGTAKVNYSYYYGQQKTTFMPDAIWDPIAYMKLKDQAELNEGKTAVDYSDADISEYQNGMKTDPFTYPANNWFDIALNNGMLQKHDVSVGGSTDKYQYRLSLGYLDRNGVMIGPNNQEKKYSIGLNTSVNVTKRLKIGLNLDGYYRQYTQPFYNSFWQYLTRTLPILTDTLKDGRYGNSWLRTPGRNNWENPRMIAYTGYSKKLVQRFLASTFLDYKLPFDITYHAQFGVDKYDGLLDEFTPQVQTFNPKTLAATNWNSPATAPRASETDYNNLSIHYYNTLNWQHAFGEDHHTALMLGSSYDNFGTSQFAGAMTGYLDATLTALDAGTVRYATSGNSTVDVLESYFGRLNYDYDGRYLLEATFRYDGSSRFADGHRWGFFPSVSAGWRIDKEKFFAQNDLFQLLKLRASVGQMGNQAVPLYSYENAIVLGQNYALGGVLQSGAAATTYSDPNISWETTTTYNVGVDAELLKRLSVTVDAYRKRTTGILRTVNIPSQVGGLAGPQENIGTMDNTGIELSARYKDRIGQVGYGVFGTLSYNKNRVVDIAGQILYNYNSSISTITKAGYPIDAFYLLHATGIFQSDDEVKSSPYQSAATRAGYLKFEDVNKDGIINGDDRKVINSSTVIPKYSYSFGLDVDYKGFTLSGVFQGVAGIKVYPTANMAFPFNNGADATKEWLTDAWTPTHTHARLPIVTESTGNADNFQASDFWLRSGAYLRLKDVQLSYALPKKWLNLARISRISVYVNAENWVTFCKYRDFDPESLLNSNTLYTYPMLKTISGGVNVNF